MFPYLVKQLLPQIKSRGFLVYILQFHKSRNEHLEALKIAPFWLWAIRSPFEVGGFSVCRSNTKGRKYYFCDYSPYVPFPLSSGPFFAVFAVKCFHQALKLCFVIALLSRKCECDCDISSRRKQGVFNVVCESHLVYKGVITWQSELTININ